jgi:signal transduction histidine kinase
MIITVGARKPSGIIQQSTLANYTVFGIYLYLIFVMIYYQYINRYYEKQLIEEQRYAAKLASEKSDILAEISHEIRISINSLIGIIDLLRKRSVIYVDNDWR